MHRLLLLLLLLLLLFVKFRSLKFILTEGSTGQSSPLSILLVSDKFMISRIGGKDL
jgi:hypothetical protein